MSEQYYRCENEYGDDACEFATSNHKIAESEVNPSVDGKSPKCPGKTLQENTCGKELVPIGKKDARKPPIPIIVGAVIGLILLAVVLVFLLSGEDDKNRKKDGSTLPEIINISDPWQVYEELEDSSKILGREQK